MPNSVQTTEGALYFQTLALMIADTRVRLGHDGDASVTLAEAMGRLGELQRLAPLIRFRDAAALEDDTAVRLALFRDEIRRTAPLIARIGRPLV